jgi:hypothetical protein
MLDGPHDGKQDGAAADDIQQVENITPGKPTLQAKTTETAKTTPAESFPCEKSLVPVTHRLLIAMFIGSTT